ncbi:hypothetical protein AAFL38_17900 [Klebsiella grimontii]|uniref:Ead/Ea22-like family protein n=1 Tax=Klebsiella grimontii TaxID=2058152 RepID=A0ABU9P4M3_9ENTR
MNISTVNELIQSLESAGELSIKETKVMALAKAYQQLAAENAELKAAIDATIGWQQSTDVENVESVRMLLDINTPATDACLAGIKADGRAEGINFAASRLAAAFNHGFVDKPMAEVFDVVRMILTAKEDLANDPVLAADGLSGEYAEKSLAEWEAELCEGADK